MAQRTGYNAFQKLHIRQTTALWVILYIAFAHGLVYVFFIPPWQHYDEPNHFEYAWLLAHHSWPVTEQDADLQMRANVLASMEQHNFFAIIHSAPAWIPISQFVDPPFYHLLAGIPIRVFPRFNVTDQMYLMRVVSLGFLLMSIAAAWGTTQELMPPAHPLRWMPPLFLALLPGFVDLMTAVNNDTAAVALSCVFFWIAARLIRRGFRWPWFLLLLLVTFLAFFTKKTTWVLGAYVPLLLFLTIIPFRRRWWVWIGCAVFAAASLVVLFQWGDTRNWYRQTEQEEFTQSKTTVALDLPFAFQLQAKAGGELPALWQNLPTSDIPALRGKRITVGAWVWANRSMQGYSPGVVYHGDGQGELDIFAKPVEITQAPRYVNFEIVVPDQTDRLLIVLKPFLTPVTEDVTVYYSGLFMIEGICQTGEIPEFSSADGSLVNWCGRSFRNLIRNGNAVDTWPAPRELTFQLLDRYLQTPRATASEWITYFLDRDGFGWYDQITRSRLFDTFWGKFGWGNVPLLHPFVYALLEALSALSLIGAILSALLQRRAAQRGLFNAMMFLLFFGIVGWSSAFLAGIYFGGITNRVVIPVARYAYPVIIPTAVVLTAGWWAWFRLISRRISSIQNQGIHLYLLLFFFLDIYSLVSIAYFYYWVKPT